MDAKAANEETRQAWNENAAYWDNYMGEGNDFVNVLNWPIMEQFLDLHPGQRVLDVACGNGLTSRRLAAMGAEVVAFDFSEALIELARQRTPPPLIDHIHYAVMDATDEAALLTLGESSFDAAICNMALFDIAELQPLIRALSKILKPGGRFIFSVMHPCFNGSNMDHVAEMCDREGKISTVYSVKVSRYLTPVSEHGIALYGQPALQLYFHRPLQALLGGFFEAGLCLDGLREPAFPPDHPAGKNPLGWGKNFSEIPPAMVVRMRRFQS